MRKLISALCLAALAIASPALAQTVPSYPYPAVGAPPTVTLQCSDAYAACLPITSGNPQLVAPSAPTAFWAYAAAAGGITNSTTAVTVKAAAGVGIRNYVASMQCHTDALGAATELAIRDGAAGTVIWRGKINTNGWLDGSEIAFNPPLRGTANTLVEIVTLTASVTGSVYCNLQGYSGS